jgi:hypothetical protein
MKYAGYLVNLSSCQPVIFGNLLRYTYLYRENQIVPDIPQNAENPPGGGFSADKTDSLVWREVNSNTLK